MKTFLTPRWLLGHAIALTLIILFINFGLWQLRRLETRQGYNALLETRLAEEPAPLDRLLERFDASASPSDEDAVAYRRVSVTGRYDPEREVLLRSRALDGQPGYHILTPLLLEDDRALLIDRGWVPYELDDPPIVQAAPPEGEVTLTGILFPEQPQPTGRLGARDPPGNLDATFWIDTERLEEQLPYRLEPLYVELASQTPAQTGRLPVPPSPPELSSGPHLGYAVQWFSFALTGILGYAFLIRSVLREAPKEGGKTRAASG